MVCVRPALANGLVFNGGGEFSANVMGLTPEPVGARGYADGPTAKLPFNAAGGGVAPATLVNCVSGAASVPVFPNADEFLTLLFNAVL